MRNDDRPVLRVISGNPTPEEIAALVAVVSSVGRAPAAPPAAPSYWRGTTRRSWMRSVRFGR